MAAAVLHSRLPEWALGQLGHYARLGIWAVVLYGRERFLVVLCVFLIYEVLRLISIQFLPLSTENRVMT